MVEQAIAGAASLPIFLGSKCVVSWGGGVPMYYPQFWLNALDRRFFREQYDARRLLGAVVGSSFTEEDLLLVGERINNLKQLFNLDGGIRREDSYLPKRIITEPIKTGVSKGSLLTEDEMIRMLDDYYDLRGWTRGGIPTEERPPAPDPDEPRRIAQASAELGLKHVVITSVTRDDLEDGGASHFARTVETLRQMNPQIIVEVLIPDFQGSVEALKTVMESGPNILNHNLETVRRLTPAVSGSIRYKGVEMGTKNTTDRPCGNRVRP
jgi:hypothetical protein